MRVPRLAAAASMLAFAAGAGHAQSPMTSTPIPYADPDNAKDTSSRARREAARDSRKKPEAAKKADRAAKPGDGRKTPHADTPG